MLTDLRTRLALLWVAAVIVIGACGVVYDVTFTASTASLWLVAVLIPPSVLLLVWPSAPPMTIAELIHAVNGPVGEGRER